jgi:PAS domain S-box-containing protein
LRDGSVTGEGALLCTDGKEIPVSFVMLVHRTASGEPEFISTIARDITEQKRGEEEIKRREQEFRALADNTPALVARFDRNLRHLYVNRRVTEVTGLPFSAYLGRSNQKMGILPELCRPGDERLRRVFETGQEASLDFTYPSPSGLRSFQSWFGPEIGSSGAVESVICITRDVTEQKALEAELRRKMEELAEAHRRKDDFLATLAHELRNPLAPIRTAIEVLHMKIPPDPDLSESSEIIERQIQLMARLLDDLLDVSRITRNKLDLRTERVPLALIIESALETSRPVIEAGGHALAVSLPAEPVYLEADPVRLGQVFSNLLNNAAKYTEPGGQITLASRIEGNRIRVSVRDTGIGIAADMLPHVFEMFAQAKPALERSQGGLGIGLSLVKGIVELHNGEVEARSEGPSRGSEFIVRLPLASSRAVARHPVREPVRRQVCRVLVADDNHDAARSLATFLRLLGHHVVIARDGEEAIAKAETFRPDVAILDIGMPRLNGYDTARRMRAAPWGANMRIVALTCWGQKEDRRRSEEAGFNNHLVKPVDPSALVMILGMAVAHRPEESNERQ